MLCDLKSKNDASYLNFENEICIRIVMKMCLFECYVINEHS